MTIVVTLTHQQQQRQARNRYRHRETERLEEVVEYEDRHSYCRGRRWLRYSIGFPVVVARLRCLASWPSLRSLWWPGMCINSINGLISGYSAINCSNSCCYTRPCCKTILRKKKILFFFCNLLKTTVWKKKKKWEQISKIQTILVCFSRPSEIDYREVQFHQNFL